MEGINMASRQCLSVWDTLWSMAKKETEPTPEMVKGVFSMMGKRGGPARAKALTAKRRKQIAKKAAAARWGKKAK